MKNCWEQGMPTIEEAKHLLEEAKSLFSGPWIEHSINAGKAAELIARNCKDLNPDVALRHGIHEHIIDKWKATFETKLYFEEKIGKSIYSILPDAVENTFKL